MAEPLREEARAIAAEQVAWWRGNTLLTAREAAAGIGVNRNYIIGWTEVEKMVARLWLQTSDLSD